MGLTKWIVSRNASSIGIYKTILNLYNRQGFYTKLGLKTMRQIIYYLVSKPRRIGGVKTV